MIFCEGEKRYTPLQLPIQTLLEWSTNKHLASLLKLANFVCLDGSFRGIAERRAGLMAQIVSFFT